jgi:hypothetical protein
MRRREFITVIGYVVAAWLMATRVEFFLASTTNAMGGQLLDGGEHAANLSLVFADTPFDRAHSAGGEQGRIGGQKRSGRGGP